MNPLIHQMSNNMLQNVLNSANPMNMAMSMLQQKNPQMYRQISGMMNSGMNPQQAIQQLGINPSQIQRMVSNFSRQK